MSPPTSPKGGAFGVSAEVLGTPFVDTTAPLRTEDLYALHARRVVRWVVRLGGPGLDSEEIAQEVFAIVHERLPAFRGTEAVVPWLYQITENVVRTHRRMEKLRRWLGGTSNEVAGELPSSEPLPLEALERAGNTRLVYSILNQMRERYRNALILYELEGLSSQQIAELKGVAVSTVWVWLHRARADFARRLEERTKGGRP